MKITYVGGGGRLGLPISVWSAIKGYDVTVADINESIVEKINNGTYLDDNYELEGIDLDPELSLRATTNIRNSVVGADMVFVIVPTPSKKDGSFSIEHVLSACREIGEGLRESDVQYPVVTIVSTVNPGDCDGPIKQKLEDTSGRRARYSLGLAYSPEFVAQGSIINDFRNPDFILIGSIDASSTERVWQYYSNVVDQDVPWRELSLVDAELAKIGLNTAVTAKMAVANQMGWICFRTPGANAAKVLDAIGLDSRVGHKYFKPGPPDGGPCFPRDGRALKHYAATLNVNAYIADAVDQFRMYQMSAISWHLGSIASTHFDQPNYAILGLTYKPGVDITEEAPGMILKEAMDEAKIPVDTYDPWLNNNFSLEQTVLYNNVIVIMTPHPEFKALKLMNLENKIIFDMWGMFDGLDCLQYIKFGDGSWLNEQA